MSREDFDRFVQRKQDEKAKAALLNPKEQVAEWLRRLDGLYKDIGKFLKQYIDKGSAQIAFDNIEINEEFSGPYEARQMFIHIGTSTIVLKPIGTMLIGSSGRVDVVGPQGVARLVLINKSVTHARQMIQIRLSVPGDRSPKPDATPKEIEWKWKIVSPGPEMRFIDLDEESFYDMMLGVADA